jgi:hypothetical protein
MRNPGKIYRLEDGRLCILYNTQPLKAQKKILLNLVDEKYNPLVDGDGKPRRLVRDLEKFPAYIALATFIGYVD